MRTSFDMESHQGTYRLRCALCGREWHDSIVGKCPEREIHVCMYCCRRLCDKSYTLPGQIGQRCRAWDAARKKPAAAGVPHPSPAGYTEEARARREAAGPIARNFPQGKPETGEKEKTT